MHSPRSPSADEPAKPLIGYAPPRHPILSFLRRHARLALLLLIAASALWWGPFVWHRGQVLYWQGRCARYSVGPDAVILEAAAPGPQIKASAVPAEWAHFYDMVSPPGLASSGTVFLHQLRRPAGDPVLVAIDLTLPPSDPGGLLAFHVRAFVPGRGVRLPLQVQDNLHSFFSLHQVNRLRIYAGQIDPADETHFTITYDLNGFQYRLDGWVREQHVDLQSRKLSTPPPPTSAAKSP